MNEHSESPHVLLGEKKKKKKKSAISDNSTNLL